MSTADHQAQTTKDLGGSLGTPESGDWVANYISKHGVGGWPTFPRAPISLRSESHARGCPILRGLCEGWEGFQTGSILNKVALQVHRHAPESRPTLCKPRVGHPPARRFTPW